jgi:phosphatidate cytidylyltransferase
MLKTRILTAVVIFAATVAVVFLSPPWLFRLLVALLMLTGCWEFRRLGKLSTGAGWVLMALALSITGLMMVYWPAVSAQSLPLLAAACLCWLFMFSRLFTYKDGEPAGVNFQRLGFFSALSATTFCWFALAWLRDQPNGSFIVFLLLLIIWASDVGAYFSGRQFGKHKLAAVISPKKTWEGVYGGIALALAAAFLWTSLVPGLVLPVVALGLMSVLTTMASVGGDLFISLHKRTVGIKDSGTLFPGHGGVLDRYDSLLAGAPFFALAYRVLGQ